MEQKRVAVLGDSILKGIQVDQSTNKYITLNTGISFWIADPEQLPLRRNRR